MKINASTKSLDERLCDLKIHAISVLSFIGTVRAPDKATTKAENHALQCTTAGPYNAIPSKLLEVRSVCGLGHDLVGIPFHQPGGPAIGLQHAHPHFAEVLKKSVRYAGTIALLSLLYLPLGNMNFLFPPWPGAQRMHLLLFVVWTGNDTLDEVPQNKKKNRKLPSRSFWTNSINKTLLGLYLVVPREPWDRSVVIVLLTSCPT